MLNLITATSIRALLPTVVTLNPPVIIALSVGSIALSLAYTITKSAGIQHIEISRDGIKVTFK